MEQFAPSHCTARSLSEVTNVYPLPKLRIVVGDITDFMERQSEELPVIAEKVVEVDQHGGGGQGFEAVGHGRREKEQSKVIASCSTGSEVSGR